MRAYDIMTGPVITVPEDANLAEAARTMLDNRIGCVVVTDSAGKATGMLTERDFTAKDAGNPFDPYRAPSLFGKNVRVHGLASLYEEARTVSARKAMRPIRHMVSEDDTVEKVVDLMVRHEVHHVPVVRHGKAVGMVSRHDLLNLVFSGKQLPSFAAPAAS